jgi:hypothetical protein
MEQKTYDRQTAKFISVVSENLPEMSSVVMQGWIQNPKSLQKVLREVLCPAEEAEKIDVSALLADWQSFYEQVFNVNIDLANLPVPERRNGFDRLIVMVPGITAQKVYEKCGEFFRTYKHYHDLDKDVPTNDRTAANGPYAIWTRNVGEADKELKNKSANQLAQKQIKGITLAERLVYELKYFTETESHLDTENMTICSGSRDSGGSGLRVGWNRGYSEMWVNDCNPGSHRDDLRAREVVA